MKTTSKNIENLQETVKLQQIYKTALRGHVNTIYTKLVQLEKQIQMHCLYPYNQADAIQIKAPE